ncbi:MAG: hypothetical protein MMC33_004609 [Icmadophila ericetorum]|nr:hypothetical protein [Icmadophila ericetorum]
MHFPIISLALGILSVLFQSTLAINPSTNIPCILNVTFNVDPSGSFYKIVGANAEFNITNHHNVSSITKAGTECDPVGCYFFTANGDFVELYDYGTVDVDPPAPQTSGQCYNQAG